MEEALNPRSTVGHQKLSGILDVETDNIRALLIHHVSIKTTGN